MLYDKLVYLAVAIIICCTIHYLATYLRNHKKLEKAKSSRVAMLCQYSGNQFRLNVMALEALREMSAAASTKRAENTR